MFIRKTDDNQKYVKNYYNNTILSMIGLYSPDKNNLSVILCPENRELEGKTYPVLPSSKNIESSANYAAVHNLPVQTYVDGMNITASMAKFDPNLPSPNMLFLLPSASFVNENIVVNVVPFGCRCPYTEKNTNIKHPIYGYLPCEMFIIDIALDRIGKNECHYDQVTYFINKRDPEIIEGYLNDQTMAEKIAAAVQKNPLTEDIFGEYCGCENEVFQNGIDALNLQICLKNHPEIVLTGNILSLYNSRKGVKLKKADEILEYMVENILCLFENKQDNIVEFVKNNVYVRCVPGFVLKESLFDSSERRPDLPNRRFAATLESRSSYMNGGMCMSPVRRVPNEDKRLLYTVRSLILLTDENHTEELLFPKGYGIVSVRKREDKKTGKEIVALAVEAGFLLHTTNPMMSAYNFTDTKYNVNDAGVPTNKALDLLFMPENEAVEAAIKFCKK